VGWESRMVSGTNTYGVLISVNKHSMDIAIVNLMTGVVYIYIPLFTNFMKHCDRLLIPLLHVPRAHTLFRLFA